MKLNTLLRITGNEYEYIFNENHVLKRSGKMGNNSDYEGDFEKMD